MSDWCTDRFMAIMSSMSNSLGTTKKYQSGSPFNNFPARPTKNNSLARKIPIVPQQSVDPIDMGILLLI
jgi:hypothetical protein